MSHGLLGGLIDKVEKAPTLVVTLNLSGQSSDPSISDLERQIRFGLNQTEIGSKLYLPFDRYGDESIPDGVRDDLREIIGQPRIIPLFETLSGTVGNKVGGLLGQKEKYRIVGFGGVVITEVGSLLGLKYIKFQPASVASQYVLRAPAGQPASYSDCVYTTPVLIE